GGVGAGAVAFCACPGFLMLEPITQGYYRRILERFVAEHADKPVALLQRDHVNKMLATKVATPTAANHWLRMIRTLMRFAVEIGMRRDDPTAGIRRIRYASRGFRTWSEEDVLAFQARHPIGTPAR